MGCYLEVIENENLTRTSALEPGFRPSVADPGPVGYFPAIISLEPQGEGTKYTATAIHPDAARRKAHEAMGFHDGCWKALDQLVEEIKKEMQQR